MTAHLHVQEMGADGQKANQIGKGHRPRSDFSSAPKREQEKKLFLLFIVISLFVILPISSPHLVISSVVIPNLSSHSTSQKIVGYDSPEKGRPEKGILHHLRRVRSGSLDRGH
jgi:hypothetical protein